MLSDEMREKAVGVISRILSESAFVFCDPLDEENRPDIGAWEAEGVSLDFGGNAHGTVWMYAGKGFLRSTAANMLGIDESCYTPEKGVDALKEILNIIVGNLLTTVYGTEPIFDLSIPQALAADSITQRYTNENAVWLTAEGEPLLFLMEI